MLDNEVTKMQDGLQEPPNANCGWSWDFVQTGRGVTLMLSLYAIVILSFPRCTPKQRKTFLIYQKVWKQVNQIH